MIEPNHPMLSIRRQCDLIGLNRSTFDWQPAFESPLNLALMMLIDKEYTRAPFYGYRKVTARLNNQHGYSVNCKRVARLMAKMGLQAIYIKEYATVLALFTGLSDYFDLYNYERPHQSLDYSTPADVHFAVKQHEY